MRYWILIVLLMFCVANVDARGRRLSYSYSSYTGSHMTYTPSEESTAKLYDGKTRSLQDIAQERAEAMARQQVLSHSIGGCRSWTGLGVTEGIGCSTVSDYRRCVTCITGRRVVADGHARSANGMVYRVRFFRN